MSTTTDYETVSGLSEAAFISESGHGNLIVLLSQTGQVSFKFRCGPLLNKLRSDYREQPFLRAYSDRVESLLAQVAALKADYQEVVAGGLFTDNGTDNLLLQPTGQ